MDNYTVELNGSKIIVKDYSSNSMVYKMNFPLHSPEEVRLITEEVKLTKMNGFNWNRSGWEIRNCLSEDSQVYSTISCKQNNVGDLFVEFSSEFEGNVSTLVLKFSDRIIELMNEIKRKIDEHVDA